MPFSVYKHGIKKTSDSLSGDAAIAINSNFSTIADLFDTALSASNLNDVLVAGNTSSLPIAVGDIFGVNITAAGTITAQSGIQQNGAFIEMGIFLGPTGTGYGGGYLSMDGGAIYFGSGMYALDDNAGGIGFFTADNIIRLQVNAEGQVETNLNTLDDSGGNMTVAGFLSVGSYLSVYSTISAGGSITGGSFYGPGPNLTSLNASALSSGMVADARLSSNVVLKSATNTATPSHSTNTAVAGSTTSLFTTTQFNGSSGTTAYTVTDIVTALKAAGILKP